MGEGCRNKCGRGCLKTALLGCFHRLWARAGREPQQEGRTALTLRFAVGGREKRHSWKRRENLVCE